MDNIQNIQTQPKTDQQSLDDVVKGIEKQLETLNFNADAQKPDQNDPALPTNSEPEEMDLLNECLVGANEKLNLTADEKDDLEDLDDEQIQKEYEEFMKNISGGTNANDFLSQLNKMMEGGFNGDANMDFGNLLGDMGDGNDFDVFTDNLITQFIDKEVIYEPLKEARQKVDELMDTAPANRSPKNIRISQILSELIGLMDKDLQKTPEGKEKIMQLFEELQDNGGLPEEIVKTSVGDNPEMAKLQEMTQGKGCTIF